MGAGFGAAAPFSFLPRTAEQIRVGKRRLWFACRSNAARDRPPTLRLRRACLSRSNFLHPRAARGRETRGAGAEDDGRRGGRAGCRVRGKAVSRTMLHGSAGMRGRGNSGSMAALCEDRAAFQAARVSRRRARRPQGQRSPESHGRKRSFNQVPSATRQTSAAATVRLARGAFRGRRPIRGKGLILKSRMWRRAPYDL